MQITKQTGFSLIEIMVVLAIVGILGAVAIPTYQAHLRKSHRAEMQAYLLDLAQRQQQYCTDNRAYATSAASLNDSMSSSLTLYYTNPVTISSGTIANSSQTNPLAFTITAYAIGSQAADGDFKLDSTGAKSPSDKW